ncbi:MAG: putative bicarbonate transporter, IctB family [Cyanobacteria bacterium]|nr:putative bicarbonate transporter, IctB family [Cyanobacteria bacterium CG_2015-16_32_12]NCO78239.1 putative bicarbonate transporter, IctB family [Cyanobacteria bacterium CG_2015-22_32_23]NCQ03744.1 putative bicarbonate transporter, IctB family [Cyanobacteria bacterium CG_2015-09_32_10]NCQ40617.1 putative bicarbonate transporter, IctB family [Cyanobacteria bacterium CG_2015-04_32_10]NCS85172.1 putative bicarbonate transporter, IctB family [Cyanobacteria bacterium CG_2015-02_32_10]
MTQAEYSEETKSPLFYWRKTSILGKIIGLLSHWQSSSYLLGYQDIIATILICLVIIAAPFTNNTLIGLILFASGIFWALLTISEIKTNQITSIHLWIFAYWLISVVATAFSPLKSEAFSGLIKFTLYLLFFALATRVFRHPKLLSWITTFYLLISLIVSSYGIRQQFLGVKPLATWNDPTSPLADATRVYSYLGNPNLLGSYLIPAVAFSVAALILWQTLPQKIFAGFLLAINTSCVYFTGSRGSWIALFVTGIIFLLGLKFWWNEYLTPFWRKWLIPIAIGGFFALLGVGAIFSETLRLRILSIFSGRGDSSNNFRINVWTAAFKMFQDSPLIGIGPGNEVFNKIYPNYMQTKFTALSAYCIFLEITLETGIIGIISFLGVISATFYRGIGIIKYMKPKNNLQAMVVIASLAAMAGLATQGLVDTVWYRPQINTLWWLCVAIIASFPVFNSSTKNHVN